MRGLTHRWTMRAAPGGPPAVEQGQDGLPLVERILRARGITGADRVEQFCSPSLLGLHRPEQLPGIERAAERLVDAVRKRESIVIYGDYDVDGITATAILYHIIRAADPEARVTTYVPHRLDEGYGLNAEALRQLKTAGANLVVTVDCGVTATAEARAARELGLELIITDHHRHDPSDLPEALALVHPALPDSRYPCPHLCGAGVAFKLAWAFATTWTGSERVGENFRKMLLHLLCFAALGTLADVVPLVDENRIIAAIGLRLIKQNPNPGLRALIAATRLNDASIDCEKVGFILAPHLNACGRMGHAEQAIRMLTTAQEAEAITIAKQLVAQNQERRQTEYEIFQRAVERAEDSGMTRDEQRIIVLADERWHRGVVGIVCSRLVDRFHRPAILMQRDNGICSGSARSVDGFSIVDALTACNDLLLTCGGHDMAAGLSLEAQRLDAFSEKISSHANAHIPVERLTPAIDIDCEAKLAEMTLPAARAIAGCSPFGRSNPRPTVLISRALVHTHPRQVGANGRHLMLRIMQSPPEPRRIIRTIWWNGGRFAESLRHGSNVDVVLEPKLNTWKGATHVEGVVRDVRLRAADEM